MGELGTYSFDITANTRGATRGLSSLTNKLGGIGSAAGAAAAAVAGMAAAGTAASIKLAADFERSLTEAAVKTDNVSESMEMFEEAAISAGLESAFSAQQASQALGLLAQAGLSAEEASAGVADVLNLASAGAIGLSQAADIATGVMRGFSLSVEELTRVNDVLASASASANTNVRQLGHAMSFAAPVAQGAGIALEETASAIGLLSDAGIKSGRAGRAFNSIVAQMTTVAEELGAELDGSTIRAEGFAGSLDILRAAGLDAENAISLFGREAGPAMQALLSRGSQSLNQLTRDLENSGGTAERMADEQLDTLSGQLQILRGTVETLAISYGQIFTPALSRATERMQDQAEAASDNDEKLGALAGGLSTLTEELGPLTTAVGGLVGALLALGRTALIPTQTIVESLASAYQAVADVIRGDFGAALDHITDIVSQPINAIDRLKQSVDIFKGGLDITATIDEFRRDISEGFGEASDELTRLGEEGGQSMAWGEEGGQSIAAGMSTAEDSMLSAAQSMTPVQQNATAVGDAFNDSASAADDYSNSVDNTEESTRQLVDTTAEATNSVRSLSGALENASMAELKDMSAEEMELKFNISAKQAGDIREGILEEPAEQMAAEMESAANKVKEGAKAAADRIAGGESANRLSAFNDLTEEVLSDYHEEQRQTLREAARREERVRQANVDQVKQNLSDASKAFQMAANILPRALGDLAGGISGGIDEGMKVADGLESLGVAMGPQGMAIAGAIGGLKGGAEALWSLASETESFKTVSNMVSEELDEAGISFEAFKEGLDAVIDEASPAIVAATRAFTEIKKAFEPLINELFGGAQFGEMLFNAVKGFAIITAQVARSFVSAGETIARAGATLLGVLAPILEALWLEELSGKVTEWNVKLTGMADAFDETGENLTDAIENIAEFDYGDTAEEVANHGEESGKAAEATESLNDSMQNVPRIFRRNLRRQQAGSGLSLPYIDPDRARRAPSRGGAGGMLLSRQQGGGGGKIVVNGDVIVQEASNADDIVEGIERDQRVRLGRGDLNLSPSPLRPEEI